MRERAPNVWELIVEAGRDPVTGRRRQISRSFRGTMREAKTARAALLTDVSKGRHTGTRITVDHLFESWLPELERKGRSPNTVALYRRTYERNIKATLGGSSVTKVNTKMLTDLYGAHQKRGLAPRSVYQIHACLSSMFTRSGSCCVLKCRSHLLLVLAPAGRSVRTERPLANAPASATAADPITLRERSFMECAEWRGHSFRPRCSLSSGAWRVLYWSRGIGAAYAVCP